jgi:hypothetical protein
MRIGKGNRSTRRKPAPVPLCPQEIPHDLTRARTRAAFLIPNLPAISFESFVEIPERKRPLWRPRHRCEDNI